MVEDSKTVASKIGAEIRRLPGRSVPEIRAVRRTWSRRLLTSNGEFVLAVARELHRTDEHSWVALELIRYHEAALARISHRPAAAARDAPVLATFSRLRVLDGPPSPTPRPSGRKRHHHRRLPRFASRGGEKCGLGLIAAEQLEEFGQGMCSWGSVDAFAVNLAGPAWLRGQVSDDLICSWARSEDRWWRRAALASTVVLNTPSRGGRGDAARTLAVCELLVDDRDDMVVKAMSWALRRLAMCDEAAVRSFMATYEKRLAARVRREVRHKLATGRKNPGPGSR